MHPTDRSTPFSVSLQIRVLLICLTLDENGIPPTVDERLALAAKIADRASSEGIAADRLLFDALTTAACMGDGGPDTTLNTLAAIKKHIKAKTVLGVSNISFGLPCREELGSAFLTAALYAGLDAAIINPLSKRMMSAYRSYLALTGKDEFCLEYIEYFTSQS